MPARIDAVSMLQGLTLGLLFTAAIARLTASPARAAAAGLSLFRVVTMRGDVLIGLTRQDVADPDPDADRLARRIARDGQVTAWRYAPRRGPDGTTRLAPSGRVCLLRQDVLMLEAHEPTLPVLPPPAA